MSLLDIRVEIALFVVSCVLVAILVFFLLIFPLIRYIAYRHFTMRMYYKHVYQVALDHDFLLVNDFKNYTANEEAFHVDHILVGDKFIYCIRDRYYDGSVEGKVDEEKWRYFIRNKKKEIYNPMMKNKKRVERLALLSSTPLDHFISIVLVNNNCFLSSGLKDGDSSYIVSIKRFPKLIDAIEKRDVEMLDPERSEMFARDLAEINSKNDK